jgi:hypothetical protein
MSPSVIPNAFVLHPKDDGKCTLKTHPRTLLPLLIATSLSFAACGKKEASPPTSNLVAPEKKSGSVESLIGDPKTEAPPPAPVPPVPNADHDPASPIAGNLDAPEPDSGQEAVLKELTAGLQVWLQVKDGYPKDLKQLADAKFITKVPTPPPGKKYAFDRAHHQVILVGQ